MHVRTVVVSLLAAPFCLVVPMHSSAQSPRVSLPAPHWHPESSDPPWLGQAVQFHGHLGPWAVSGIRLGILGREAVGSRGYFDLTVTCRGPFAKPPRSCFLDGLQVGTGATLGKRNLRWVEAEQIAVELTNTRTGRTAVVRPAQSLLDRMAAVGRPKPDDHKDDDDHDDGPAHAALESLARKIAALPDEMIARVEIKSGPQSE